MTIYALSSGPGISGIAVIRISGPETKIAIEKMTKKKERRNWTGRPQQPGNQGSHITQCRMNKRHLAANALT